MQQYDSIYCENIMKNIFKFILNIYMKVNLYSRCLFLYI